jgi:hypothetical protein
MYAKAHHCEEYMQRDCSDYQLLTVTAALSSRYSVILSHFSLLLTPTPELFSV